MPRRQSKPSTNLISEDILREIKSFRPLCLFINKQKKKGNLDNPFTLRVKFCQLSREKQARYLQKSVDKYIELLDEKDIDESIQIECKLFDYLLMKGDQKKYFQSINAPIKPPGTAVPYYTQIVKQEHDDDYEISWKSLSLAEKRSYKKMRAEAKSEYSAQVKNFANDLPERLRTDYLLFTEELPHKRRVNTTTVVNGCDNTDNPEPIRQRRKSLTALPESLQTTPSTDDVQLKLTKVQLQALHQCLPSVLYYEKSVSDDDKPTFTRTMTKNAYIRSIFNQLSENKRLKYILLSVEKWNEFLELNPNITQNQIPTLHLLLGKNEDIALYFYAIGLPERPPLNSYLLYNLEKDQTDSLQSWIDLPRTQRHEYSQQLIELKTEYYQKLVEFVDHNLTTDYMKYEFFRNIKFAIRDYELATKSEIIDKNTGQFKLTEYYRKKIAMKNDMVQCNQIKESLLSTQLTNEQKQLVEELTQLLYKYIE